MAGGRPLKFRTVAELQKKIDAYFDSVKEPKKIGDDFFYEPVTITGLALALDTSRETLINYEERPEFFDTIKRAKTMVEHYAEKQLYMARSPTGAIFALKNHGWTDKRVTEHSGSISLEGLYGAVAGKNDGLPT